MVSPILLVSFLITLLLASAVSIHGVQVNDTNGNPVKVDEQYIIRRVNGRGSLFPYTTGSNQPFPIIIVETPVNYPGDPVSFAVAWPKPPKTIVDTDHQITIEFTICEGCKVHKYWGYDDSSSSPKERALFVGADPEKINSWFQIRIFGENIYELVSTTGTVGNVGIGPVIEAAGKKLVLTNDTAETLLVRFEKVVGLKMNNYGDATSNDVHLVLAG